jgi:hypothetical protein
MKKKLIFLGIIMLALVLTTGTFAYTYSNTTQNVTTVQGILADDEFTTYQVSEEQPDWNSIMPEDKYNIEILFPVAAGDDTEFPTQFPDSGEHWDKVADMGAADTDAYISTQGSGHWERDLYHLSPFYGMGGLAKISNIIVYFRIAAGGDYDVKAMAALKINGNVFEGPNETTSGTNFVTYSWQCDINPSTNEAWTWEELNQLQAGLTAKGDKRNNPALCTQVYVVVNYTYAIIQGSVPEGDLFDITPHPDYTGDLLVKIYLTNVVELIKAYEYVNIKVHMTDSLEAAKTPDYQIIAIDTGVAIFNIEGGTASTYTVSITGGAYCLISDTPEEWGPGWSVRPEFYCEVAQR